MKWKRLPQYWPSGEGIHRSTLDFPPKGRVMWSVDVFFVFSPNKPFTWWRHQMETFSALLAICAGNSPVAGEFPTQRPVTQSFDVFFDLRLNKRLGKQSWWWWFETLSRPLWRHCNEWPVFWDLCDTSSVTKISDILINIKSTSLLQTTMNSAWFVSQWHFLTR